jgi:Ser/Thr protein kinase RdoA (MazF antagonist)
MRLSTMLRVDAAVDDDGRSPIAEEILAEWDADSGTARFFRSSANFVFRFERAGRPHFLRFAHDSERSREQVESEMAIVAALHDADVRVAAPVPSRSRGLVSTCDTDLGTFHAVVLQALEGETLDVEDLGPAECEEWGAALGRLHRAFSALPAEIMDSRRSWRDDLDFVKRRVPNDRPSVRDEFARLSDQVSALAEVPGDVGLIHFDFELDNLVWTDGGIAMLDFDECARYPRGADVAFALRDLFEDGYHPTDERLASFLHGYEPEHASSGDVLGALPAFVRFSALLQYARIRYADDLTDDDAQPPWMVDLRGRLANAVDEYEASLGEA